MPRRQDAVTPVRRQYLELKRQYPNAILFFRLGDFYETFDEDAEIVSRELDIVLTSRNVAKGVRVPMAGIPYHAVEGYLAKLIAKGYHVAIAEQIGEPGKGLMRREVVRVVTPGTVVEPNLIPAETNNYLVAVVVDERRAGLAYADITTGEFAATELVGGDLEGLVRAELLRLRPAELLHPEEWTPPADAPGHSTPWPGWRFEVARCEEALREHFAVAALDGFGLRGKTAAVQAAGAIVQYLRETQPAALKLLTGLSTYSLQEFMVLDPATRRNLELTETLREGRVEGSLLGVLDRTVTPMGKRLLRQWVNKPLLDVARIHQRQQGVAYFVEHGLVRAEVRQVLRRLGDLERLTNRVLSGTAQPRDLVALRETLRHLPALRQALPAAAQDALGDVWPALDPCSEALDLLERAIAEEPPATLQHIGVIRSGFSEELDRVVRDSQHARDYIANLEQVERQRTGIKNLKVGYNKVFGYYIEVTKANAHQVPKHYIRKQTLVNAERYITPEMKEYEALVLHAEERIREIEGRLFKQVCQTLSGWGQRLLTTARAVAQLDVLAALAEAAVEHDYTQPEVLEEDVLAIYDGRHPVVERTLEGERFVPNDTVFEEGERIRILTGPNMAGKSTYLRQVALIVLMAQMGSFVPARKARIGVVDRIFTRIGAQDEIHAGQSTFMVEMVETAHILHHATPRSLIILDEIGRGTSTYDGLAIAWAVVEYIHNHPRLRAKTLFATHYHELTHLADLLPGVRNYNVAVTESEGRVVFLHKIVPGGADRSYGVHVAQLAGMPKPVVQRAQELLTQFEQGAAQVTTTPRTGPQQLMLFPETNPLLEELKRLDINNMTPLEALNRLYEWQRRFLGEERA